MGSKSKNDEILYFPLKTKQGGERRNGGALFPHLLPAHPATFSAALRRLLGLTDSNSPTNTHLYYFTLPNSVSYSIVCTYSYLERCLKKAHSYSLVCCMMIDQKLLIVKVYRMIEILTGSANSW